MARPKKHIVPVLKLPPKFKTELFCLLGAGQKVEIDGLGVFEIKRIPQKTLFHNFSGRRRVIKAYKKLKFTQSAELKKTLTEHE